jgi:hypothetical protein
LKAAAHVSVRFIDESAGYRKASGYVSDTGSCDIVSLQEPGGVEGVNLGWVFPNASKQFGGGAPSPAIPSRLATALC